MSAEDRGARAVAADFIDAFNQADWERFRSQLADDAVYEEAGTGRRVEGADPYVELCKGWRRALPDCRGTIRSELADGPLVAQEIVWEGTHDGPLETPAGALPASGRRVDVGASVWYRFDGDRIAEVHHHLDVLALLEQVGALPTPGG
jgi:steroid delta-isomerase-like uncharacterized protein